MDSKRLRELAGIIGDYGPRCLSRGDVISLLAFLTDSADALDGLTAEDVAGMREREDAGCAAMSEDGNYDELCRQDKARLLAVVEKLMGVRNAGS